MSGKKIEKRHKWALDLAQRVPRPKAGRRSQKASFSELPAPFGYTSKKKRKKAVARNDKGTADIIVKKSWNIVLYGPLQQVPTNLFLMVTSGNQISIWSIMMLGMMFIQPVRALLSVQQTFKRIQGYQAGVQRIGYLLGILFALMLAVYKSHVMGLLPIYPSDWLAFVEQQRRLEWSGGGFKL